MKQSEELRAKLDELHISARETYNKSLGNEQYQRIMIDVYDLIRECIDKGMVHTNYWIDDFALANRVFRELAIQGYKGTLEKDDGAAKEWCLYIDWSDVDLDPNKKYILPMEGTDIENSYDNSKAYAYRHDDGHWSVGRFYGEWDGNPTGIVVTAKDIEEAPDWVKALEPVEV